MTFSVPGGLGRAAGPLAYDCMDGLESSWWTPFVPFDEGGGGDVDEEVSPFSGESFDMSAMSGRCMFL